MILPRNEFTIRVDRALEVVPAARAVEIVLHVVFACPQQLHRYTYFFRDVRRFVHEVVVQASTESTT